MLLSPCLNPCSNGIWSLTGMSIPVSIGSMGLNPCSNGIWSLTLEALKAEVEKTVLILVLMEYGL